MSARVLKISATGQYEFCDVEPDEDGITLATLQEAVGGCIEHLDVNLPCGTVDMWLNEEGKLIGLRLNETATSLSGIWRHGDFVTGDVILCGHTPYGNSVGLTPDEEKALREALA